MAQSCARCGRENPDGARFCMECGAALERRCPSCGEAAPPAARFCMACGHALSESGAILRPEAARPAEPPPEERRQVTVLFADLSGYTAVAETMDPEALKALVDRCLRRLAQQVTDHGGTVDKYIGDNIMALFGAPVAHEDDTERAIRAGLGMLGAMADINDGLEREYGVTFDLRVGVNTGEVLAGAVGGAYTVMGDTVNVASRLQAAARPGSVTVGPRTYEATVGVVDYRELQPLELKGKAEPVKAWEAVALRAARPVRRGGLRESPLVGRADELKLLESLYDRVERERRPHLVTMLGEAGVGKSRMLRELRECLGKREQPPGFHEGRCLPYGSGIVYWALGEVIRAEFDVRDTDPSDVAWQKLSEGVGQLLAANGVRDEPASRHATRIARLLGVDIPPDVELAEDDDPERMREGYFSAVRTMVEAMAAERPLVLAFEDIHWADQGMLDLIEYIAAWVRGPLLLLCLTRDELFERRPNWGSGRRNTTSIVLDPLDREETSRLVSALLGNPDYATGAMAPLIAERAGGNPLFAEELVRRLEEKGDFSVTDLPDTVQALLAARLDSLESHERRLIQQAAVVGRHFWVGSLGDVNGNTESALGSLLEKDLIMPSEGAQLAGETEYAFKHVLIRDVAYATLPKAVRCRRHFEVGEFVERRAGDRTDEFVALLADHYGRAATLGEEIGLPAAELAPMHAKALSFVEAAGDAATSIYSNEEAFDQYEVARALGGGDEAVLARIAEKQGDVALRLGRVDAAVELWQGCLEHHRFEEALERVGDLHRKVGAALWHKGESKQAIEHYQRGINLLKDGPPSLELVHLYEEAASLYMRTGDNMLAIYAAEKALRLAERLGERRAAGRAHGIFGRVFGRIGDTAKARENLERSVALARDTSRSETIRALLTLGDHLETSEADYAGADGIYTEALQLAEQLGDLPAQVELQSALAVLAAYRADWETAEERTESSAALAEREGLVGKLAYPYGLRGLLFWRRGEADAAVDAYKRSHEMAEQVGWSEVAYSALYGLSLVLRDRRDFSGAVTALDQALDVCERAGLVGQSILALGLRASVLRAAGRTDQAREAAEEASRLAERLPYPVGQAAALEARGAVSDDLGEAVALLEQARQRWDELGRPLDGARCTLTAGRLLAQSGSPQAREVLERVAEEVTRLGVPHLAEEARAVATTAAAPPRSDT